ncbi:MAG: ion transporter [Muribaculaceae bacterium]|nr:ion transporter [Muribaculaceae bacterium]
MKYLTRNITDWIDRHRPHIYTVLNWIVLVLSLALVIYLSVNILSDVDFMKNTTYMRFQLMVCMVFMAVFFIEFALSRHKWHYLCHRWLFFFLSVPYVYILGALQVPLSPEVIYFIHFVPLARGVLAGSMVVGYVSSNRITGIFFSYIVVMLAFVYFGSLIFWVREQGLNPELPDYGAALWWACSQATTVGCTIYPVSAAGKIIAAVLAVLGTTMFPLFTVYITNVVQGFVSKRSTASSTVSAKNDMPDSATAESGMQ